MDEAKFLALVIDDAIAAARLQYPTEQDHLELEGALAGLDECRDADVFHLPVLLDRARADTAANQATANYDWWRCRAKAIGWVADVISAARYHNGLTPLTRVSYPATVAVGRLLQKMPP